ncbi:tudor domain-containing protein 7A [Galendromus occidentalis]|uniref:Tudor domain-containing protein 7A n=1 Tax=Galendromus occidentalis TaxID=34638 RepID=A0AAJ6QXK6_9ACAR|nr:tudor domain-containing protein 7A [Galendromus occidentalis]
MPADLEETKILISSILTASENALSLGQLEAEYKMMENEFIPFKELGFKSLIEFLNKCPDCVRVVHSGGTAQVLPVVSDEVKHIRDFVENQRSDGSKKVAYKITQVVEENILRLLAKKPGHRILLSELTSLYKRAYQAPLPAPKGKLVAWLATSNKFAILSCGKNLKHIEALSHVNLNHYKSSVPLAELSALRASVQKALSGAQRSCAQSEIRVNRSAPTSRSSNLAEVQSAAFTQHTTTYAPAVSLPAPSTQSIPVPGSSPSKARKSPLLPTPDPSLRLNATMGSSIARFMEPRCSPEASAAEPKRPPLQPVEAAPKEVARELTSEKKQFLIRMMMKNPESTSVTALRRAYEYNYGAIDTQTFLDWLFSMDECLVIGADSGRVYLRPQHRVLATPNGYHLPIATATRSVAVSQDTPPTQNQLTIPVPPHDFGAPVSETLKVTIQGMADQTSADPGQTGLEVAPDYSEEDSDDRVLEGICGLSVTDIVDVMQLLWSKPKVPLDQLLEDFEATFQRRIDPIDGVEALVEKLSTLGLVKVAPNSDVSLFSPVRLRTFDYVRSSGVESQLMNDELWSNYIAGGPLCQGYSTTGKILCYSQDGSCSFVTDWSPPDSQYVRTEIVPQGQYVYCNDGHKLNAIAQVAVSRVGHWQVFLPDLQKFRPCRAEQLLSGPPQPVLNVIPIGRCPPVGENIKLTIVKTTETSTEGYPRTYVSFGDEEVVGIVKSRADPNFAFRLLRWDHQRFIPREDLAKLSLDRGLTLVDPSALEAGDVFSEGDWMNTLNEKLFIAMSEFVELLDTMGFRADAIHDLLLI